MYLSYFDSSGDEGLTDSENYVLAAVIVDECDWHYVDDGINKIKKNYFADYKPENVDLHVRKMINHDGIYKRVSMNKVYSLLDDVFGFISNSNTPLNIIASLIKKEKMHPKVDMKLWNYRFIFDRFNLYMVAKDGYPDHARIRKQGIVIIDNEKYAMNQKLHDKLSGLLLKSKTAHPKSDRIVEKPFFSDSKLRNLIQISDCVSYCIRKKYRTGNLDNFSTKRWQKYYSMIENKFYSKDGKYLGYGLKIFP